MRNCHIQDLIFVSLSLAMSRDGSSGGLIRLASISKKGVERHVLSGDQMPKFWRKSWSANDVFCCCCCWCRIAGLSGFMMNWPGINRLELFFLSLLRANWYLDFRFVLTILYTLSRGCWMWYLSTNVGSVDFPLIACSAFCAPFRSL